MGGHFFKRFLIQRPAEKRSFCGPNCFIFFHERDLIKKDKRLPQQWACFYQSNSRRPGAGMRPYHNTQIASVNLP